MNIHSTRITAGILAIYCLLSVGFHRATPFLEATDEGSHSGVVMLLKEQKSFLKADPRQSTIAQAEITQAPLYYLLSAFLISPLDTSDAKLYFQKTPGFFPGNADIPGPKNLYKSPEIDDSEQADTLRALRIIRIFSALLGLGTVLLTMLLVKELSCKPWTVAFAGILVAANPMFLFIHNSVNNDCLVVFLCTLTFYLLAKKDFAADKRSFTLGIVVGLAVLSKLSALILLPVVLLFLLLKHSNIRATFSYSLKFVLSAGAICGWWFIRNLMLYGQWNANNVHIAIGGNARSERNFLALAQEWDGFVKSYWGVFGGFNIIYPDWVYFAFYLLTLVVLLLAARSAWRTETTRCFAAAAMINLIAVAYWTSFLWGSQGRLMFPSIAAISVLAALGLSNFPGQVQKSFFCIIAIFLFSASATAAWVIIPSQYL